MRAINFILVMGLFFYSVGCSNPLGKGGSLVDGEYGPGQELPAAAGYGVISGVANGSATALGRKAEISVGSKKKEMVLTTSLNRTLIVSVQGQLLSQ